MNIETLRNICTQLPHVTEDIKWGSDLCFLIGEKMFCVTNLEPPFTASLKVTDEEFAGLSNSPGIIPAPYVARYKWIFIEDANRFNDKEWAHYIVQSYNLVKAKLPKKVLAQLK
jgi:predicted DNA-binding protein (MmcQ/YjbR family)